MHPAPGAKLAARIHDKRVRYVRLAKNEGIAANTNVGLAEAEGEWITLLDHDDALSPNALYEVAKAACESGAELIYSDEVVLDSAMKRLAEYHFKPGYSPTPCAGAIISRTCAPSRRSFSTAQAAKRTRSLTARRTTTSSCACARRPKASTTFRKCCITGAATRRAPRAISQPSPTPEGRRRCRGRPPAAAGPCGRGVLHSRLPGRIPHAVCPLRASRAFWC